MATVRRQGRGRAEYSGGEGESKNEDEDEDQVDGEGEAGAGERTTDSGRIEGSAKEPSPRLGGFLFLFLLNSPRAAARPGQDM